MGITETLSPRYIDDRDEFKEAAHFRETITPVQETDYEWAYDYSKEMYERYLKVYKDLDDKANEIVKYLGGGAGLFTLGVILNVRPETAGIVGYAIPSFLVALAAACIASTARLPALVCLPPDPETAFDYANRFASREIAKGAFIGEWHLASVGMKLAIDTKAKRVRLATWTFFGAIFLLIFPMFKSVGIF
jgi:hypothetical protein